jgi:hypothetical protein
MKPSRATLVFGRLAFDTSGVRTRLSSDLSRQYDLEAANHTQK